MSKKIKIAVLGAGNMGTCLAQVVAKNGFAVDVWNYPGDPEPLQQIQQFGENKKYAPGVMLSRNLNPEPDIAKAVSEAKVVFFVVPSNFIRSIVKTVFPHLSSSAVCVDASKGMDSESLRLTTDVLRELLPKNSIATISGPAIAKQMAQGGFTSMNVASDDKNAITLIKKVLENKNLKLISTNDIVGVELCGSFKNVYAIGLGICDGLGYPTNTKAMLLCEALREMSLIIQKMRGQVGTVYGLAGLGDLVGTGFATASRNRRLGEFLAQGLNLEAAMAQVGQVAEGVVAVKILKSLSKKHKLEIPFADVIYRIVQGRLSPKSGMESFLTKLK